MSIRPVARVEDALAATVRRHRIPLGPDITRLLARIAVDALANVDPQPVEIPTGTMPAPADLTLLRMVANGATVTYLARVSHRSPEAIDQQLQRICLRIGARTLAQAVAVCLARGWIGRGDLHLPAGMARRKPGPKGVVA